MLVDPRQIAMLAELGAPGEPDPVDEILALYDREAADGVDRVARAHASRDAEALRQAAHRLKGASVGVGAVALARRLEGIERAAREGAFEEASVDVAALAGLLDRTLTALRALRHGPPGGPTG